MASFYNFFMRPLEAMGIRKARSIIIKEAYGSVLELGAGTGANLPFYNFDKIDELIVTDKVLSKHLPTSFQSVTFVAADATNLPFEDHRFDVVVHTLVFCSVDGVHQALQEIRRVLKPGGLLIFIEHVLPQKKGLNRLFRTINPMWKTVSHGCSLTKDFQSSLIENQFVVDQEETFLNTVFYYGFAHVSRDKGIVV